MDKDRIAGSAKDFAGKVESTVGDLAGDAKTQAEGRAREAAGTVQNLYGQAKDAARDATDAAVNYAKDAYENSGDTVRSGQQLKDAKSPPTFPTWEQVAAVFDTEVEKLAKSGEDPAAVAKTVQQNPLGALLVAGGIGFALALLMTRPPRRPPARWRYYG